MIPQPSFIQSSIHSSFLQPTFPTANRPSARLLDASGSEDHDELWSNMMICLFVLCKAKRHSLLQLQ